MYSNDQFKQIRWLLSFMLIVCILGAYFTHPEYFNPIIQNIIQDAPKMLLIIGAYILALVVIIGLFRASSTHSRRQDRMVDALTQLAQRNQEQYTQYPPQLPYSVQVTQPNALPSANSIVATHITPEEVQAVHTAKQLNAVMVCKGEGVYAARLPNGAEINMSVEQARYWQQV